MKDDQWSEYWSNRWANGQTRWHQDEIEPLLIQFFPALAPTTVLVPLCGKTKDLVYLASLGHRVVGVELSPLACQAFFEENQFSYVVERSGDFSVYRSEKIEILCGDIFKLTSAQVKGLGAIYDRAASIALPDELRRKYVEHLKGLICASDANSVPILLIVIDYQSDFVGPPFAVSEIMVRKFYADGFEVERVSSSAEAVQLNRDDVNSVTEVVESAYLIR